MEIRGLVHEVGATQQVSDTFKKRNLVLEYAENPEYKEYIQFEAVQDKTALLDQVKSGDEVEVSFNITGKPFTNKEGKTSYFNALKIWRISKVATGAPRTSAPANEGIDDDSLPF